MAERPNQSSSAAYEPRDLAMQTLDGTLPYEETWRENAVNVLHLLNELERLRGERFDTSDMKTRARGLATPCGHRPRPASGGPAAVQACPDTDR